MLRFILGFIFFGLLFYALYLYAPDTFHALVNWASDIFDYLKSLFEKYSGKSSTPTPKA